MRGPSFERTTCNIPFTKDDLCQVWLKLAQWFWRRRLMYFRNFLIICPWKKKGGGGFNWTNLNLNPFHPRMHCMCRVWLKFVQWFWRRRWKCEKFTTTTTTITTTTITTTTDKVLSEKLNWAFGSGELKTGCFSSLKWIHFVYAGICIPWYI